MTTPISIQKATTADIPAVATMVGELLGEIMTASGSQAFNFDQEKTIARLRDFLDRGKYTVFVARHETAGPIGFINLYESHALYAEGSFGTVPELYVRPEYRSARVGEMLMDAAKAHGRKLGWTRLEVTTPPLPAFDRTLAFYQREGFAITGGRKLKVNL